MLINCIAEHVFITVIPGGAFKTLLFLSVNKSFTTNISTLKTNLKYFLKFIYPRNINCCNSRGSFYNVNISVTITQYRIYCNKRPGAYKFFPISRGALKREGRLYNNFVLRGALNNLRQFCDKIFCFF